MNFRVLKKFWKSPRTSLFLKKGHEPWKKFSFLKMCLASVLLSKAFGYRREECVCLCVCVCVGGGGGGHDKEGSMRKM